MVPSRSLWRPGRVDGRRNARPLMDPGGTVVSCAAVALGDRRGTSSDWLPDDGVNDFVSDDSRCHFVASDSLRSR